MFDSLNLSSSSVINPHFPNCSPFFTAELPKAISPEPTRLKFCNPSSERKFFVAFKSNLPSTTCKDMKLDIRLMLSLDITKSFPTCQRFLKHPISRTSKLFEALITNDPPTDSRDGNAVDSTLRCTPETWSSKFWPTFSRFVAALRILLLRENVEEDGVSI